MSQENKRYYWLKFKEDFFTSKRIKKLRKIGADYVIIYLKMQLKALKNDGYLPITGIEDSVADEIALDIDEDSDKVQITLSYLQACGLIETENDMLFLPYVQENTGSETANAQRVRDYRNRQKLLQCNTSVTQVKQLGNAEKEIEIEKEIDIDNKAPKRFKKPTLEELQEYILEKHYNVDAEKFLDYYESNGWKVGKNSMKDWKATVRNWNRNNTSTVVKPAQSKNKFNNFSQRDTDFDALEKKLLGY